VPDSDKAEKILIDTYAWIEYFKGSEEGLRAKKFIEGQFKLVTPSIVIAELSDKYRRTGVTGWSIRNKFIKFKSKILLLDEIIADEAGKLKQDMKKNYKDVGLADAIILAHSAESNAKILTGDRYLRQQKHAIDITL